MRSATFRSSAAAFGHPGYPERTGERRRSRRTRRPSLHLRGSRHEPRQLVAERVSLDAISEPDAIHDPNLGVCLAVAQRAHDLDAACATAPVARRAAKRSL